MTWRNYVTVSLSPYVYSWTKVLNLFIVLNILWYTTWNRDVSLSSTTVAYVKQELIKRWDSERELFYNNAHVEASAYAHWTSS